MNGKHFVGRRVSSVELYDNVGPITAVAILLDDNNEILVGDDTGYTLEIDCPYGTQAMAETILAQVSGQTYKGFRAQCAKLDPTAELGDGVTVDGVYSVLAYRSVNFGPGHMAEIAAPGENTLEHEYQYKSPIQRQTDRKFAQTRSVIEKTTDAIRLAVEGLAENFTELKVTLDGVTVTDSNGTTKIKGNSIETDTLYVNAANINGTLTADQIDASNLNVSAANITGTLTASQINLSGSITWGDLSGDVQSTIYAQATDLPSYIKSTKITETTIESPNITGGTITGGEVYGGAYYDLKGNGQLTLSYGDGSRDDMAQLLFESVVNNQEMFEVFGYFATTGIFLNVMLLGGKSIFQYYSSQDKVTLTTNVDISGPLGTAVVPHGTSLPSSGSEGQVFFLHS